MKNGMESDGMVTLLMKNVDYSILRTFGCAALTHQSEGKLKPRTRKCVFLGYPKRVKRYRLWDRS